MWFIIGGVAFMLCALLMDNNRMNNDNGLVFLLGAALFILGLAIV